jgi:hypothetical protein
MIKTLKIQQYKILWPAIKQASFPYFDYFVPLYVSILFLINFLKIMYHLI